MANEEKKARRSKVNLESLLTPHVEVVQKWVNENITAGVAKTATQVAGELVKLIPELAEVPVEDVAVSFRFQVKLGKIERISGRKRVGYCLIGSEAPVSANTPKKDVLEDHIEVVQKWIDENITDNVALTAKQIGEKLTEVIPDTTAGQIIDSFRKNVKAGTITGIEGRRRIGYCKIGSDPGVNDPDDVDIGEGLCIEVGPNHRIKNVDKRNWALQKQNGENWVSKAWWGNLDSALKGTARRLLNKELRASSVSVSEFSELAKVIQEAESRVVSCLGEKAAEVKA